MAVVSSSSVDTNDDKKGDKWGRVNTDLSGNVSGTV